MAHPLLDRRGNVGNTGPSPTKVAFRAWEPMGEQGNSEPGNGIAEEFPDYKSAVRYMQGQLQCKRMFLTPWFWDDSLGLFAKACYISKAAMEADNSRYGAPQIRCQSSWL